MKSIKSILAVATLSVAALVTTVSAQEKGKGGRGGMTPEQQITRIEEAVGTLSADVKTKVTAILEKAQKDVMALPQEERMEKGREIRQAAMKEVRALLTPEQQAKFDAMPQGGRGGGGGGGKKKGN